MQCACAQGVDIGRRRGLTAIDQCRAGGVASWPVSIGRWAATPTHARSRTSRYARVTVSTGGHHPDLILCIHAMHGPYTYFYFARERDVLLIALQSSNTKDLVDHKQINILTGKGRNEAGA